MTSQVSNVEILKRWGWRLLPWAVVVAIVWAIVQQRHGDATGMEGTQAPAVVTELSDGTRLDLRDGPGELVVLNFWATWCGPCRAEAPELSQVHRELRGEDRGRVVGLSVDRGTLEATRRAAGELGMRYPIGVAGQELVGGFGVQVLPTTFVLEPGGRVRESFVGGVTAEDLRPVWSGPSGE